MSLQLKSVFKTWRLTIANPNAADAPYELTATLMWFPASTAPRVPASASWVLAGNTTGKGYVSPIPITPALATLAVTAARTRSPFVIESGQLSGTAPRGRFSVAERALMDVLFAVAPKRIATKERTRYAYLLDGFGLAINDDPDDQTGMWWDWAITRDTDVSSQSASGRSSTRGKAIAAAKRALEMFRKLDDETSP